MRGPRPHPRPRTGPTLEREMALWDAGHKWVAGIDEAGRGPLAGPVFAAAVVLAAGSPIDDLNDSKQLTAKKRVALARTVREHALAWAVAGASVREIDRGNILRATARAMRRAVQRLAVVPTHFLVDGTPFPEIGFPHESIIDGDAQCQSIAAASILAKTVRDTLMDKLACRYARYGWDHNRGYGTEDHLHAIQTYGPTPHHRVSFAPMNQRGLW